MPLLFYKISEFLKQSNAHSTFFGAFVFLHNSLEWEVLTDGFICKSKVFQSKQKLS